ncbi:undecaprenyldiphospho-muramoylpentapeptide beta-N-acetylglucosaminyltransferase [Microbaculum marinisediminis]|uniref:UDP-N-acetylglucosamine--N-acetylmuramyl-(pentapeptide) pyrophosphoryl-undecaprenol N-acetylglucosamine transferase n=1 Tax=Microbaculum marinisediminis TaxID=2931392 RepID=A0AAW5QZL1_9HYPH|nr:undecaprenyldiphospho-muramoylpentapeptide beta-N-acetylglucosaminyltransferase [Microbaculum sp. A6E488]MCT8972577.1 undecaprenyldiphospho-muramoylpentapeptide beta-N-acetylglucosaminyltransferase [Microbaculum sp. A6E488]
MSGEKGLILLSAGGTGGHLFPAQALAEVLISRGWRVDLVTDERGDRYGGKFPAQEMHIIPATTVRGGNILSYAKTAFVLGIGVMRAWFLISRLKPRVVVGFGGYPTVSPVIAASLRGVRTIIHDQNAVMGRANRMLADRVDAVATSFPKVHMLGEKNAHKAVRTGAPVRAAVVEAATPYDPPEAGGEFRLLVFGGSQGARIFSDVVPGAIARLDEAHRNRLRLVQQCREEDMERVRFGYEAIGVNAELAPFFPDLPKRIADAHLVVSRSGASTVAELAVIGRPGMLVPLPHAIDNDQLLNATALAQAKGGWLMPQPAFTPHRFAEELTSRMDHPEMLSVAAEAARKVGNPHAADTLADVVEALAEGREIPPELKGATA